MKNWLIGKDPYAGKDQRQEEKGMTEHEIIRGLSGSIEPIFFNGHFYSYVWI